MDSNSRTAFTATLLLDRRQANSAAIAAVAVDRAGLRLYLGLEDGVLEEHAIVHSAPGPRSSLAARKHAAKKAILGIHTLHDQGLVVLLGEDGLVQLLDAESLEGGALPLRHAVGTCVAAPAGRLPRLAVATKPSKKLLRLLVYELPSPAPSGGGRPRQAQPPAQLLAQLELPDAAPALHGMAWVGGRLALCAGLRYLLAAPLGPPLAGGGGGERWRELLRVPEELAYSPAMLAAVPDRAQAVMVVGPAGILVDGSGSPVGSALRLEGLGATPRALAASGALLLVASEGGMHVFDAGGGGELQRLGFGPGLHPAPGQPLHAAAADPGGPAAAADAADGGDPGGGRAGCVAVAGRRLVWLCVPVLPADQARELLGQGQLEAALDLVERGLRRGAGWAQTAAAQAALLLLHECRFGEAAACLERCSPATFQPAQLFPLWPDHTAAWANQAPAPQRYWGLHPPLPSLDALIAQHLGSADGGSPTGEQRGGGGGGRQTGARRPGRGGQAPLQEPAGGAEEGQGEGRGPQNGSLQPPADNVQQQRQQLQRQARESLAQYLFRARMLEGVACLEGLDSLLLLLLADLGDGRQVAAFAAVPNRVRLEAVQRRLLAEGWHHALATLHAARGDADVALATWRHVAEGAAGPATDRTDALAAAAALLRSEDACPQAVLLAHLPWLLAASEAEALGVLTARELPPGVVLPLLPPGSDARWRYLAHLVAAEQGCGQEGDRDLHTELATQLAAAILREDPSLRLAHAPPGGSPRRRVSGTAGDCGRAGRPPSRTASGAAALPAGLGLPGEPGVRRRSLRTTAALVSGGGLEPAAGAPPADAMRLRLRAHLEQSGRYDAEAVLAVLQDTGLHEELVVLHAKMGNHVAALRLLALTLHDVAAAEAYVRAHLPPRDFPLLLHLVLQPGQGLQPRWADAAYLIAALGDHLEPQEVLQALPPGMPLAAAAPVLAPMLRDRLHRRRAAALTKSLQRARLAAGTAAQRDAEAAHVTVDEERSCPRCHLRLGGKVFVVLQPGAPAPRGDASLVAPDALGTAAAAAAAAAGGAPMRRLAQQQQQQQADGEPGVLRPPGDDGLAAAIRGVEARLRGTQQPQALCYACYRRLLGQGAPALPAAVPDRSC